MSSFINTNINSLNAQRNLSMNQASLSTSMERLSSGLRINSAKDDAAGLAISQRMTAQINGLNQASRNANDAISLSQTAEGALGSISDNLQRMRQLAVQAANGTNSASDRQAIQAEVSQLQQEINRVAGTTQFNGTNLLDGTLTNTGFQVGANADQTISLSIASAKGTDIGNYTSTSVAALSTAQTAAANGGTGDTFQISGNGQVGASITTTSGESASSIAASINGETSSTGVTATALTTATITAIGNGNVAFTLQGANASAVNINATVSNGDYSSVAQAINAQSAQTNITAALNSSGGLVLTDASGEDIKITTADSTGMQAASIAGSSGSAVALTGGTATVGGAITLSSSSGYSVNDTAGATIFANGANGGSLTSVASITVDTVSGATAALNTIDAALNNINSQRANLGAIQNRFTSTISNLATSTDNLTASRSGIQDADFAQETANLSRAQILQQAGTAMVAQANQQPQGVLALLR